MSEFLLAGYGREEAAAHALGVLRANSDELPLDLNSTALVQVGADGQFTITTMPGSSARYPSSGMLWGALFELIFRVPLAGTTYGPSLGGVFGALDRAGLDADFRARVRRMLGPQTSCLAFLARAGDPVSALDRFASEPDSILRVSLSRDQEAELVRELGGVPPDDDYALHA